jgi:hypothetical protein
MLVCWSSWCNWIVTSVTIQFPEAIASAVIGLVVNLFSGV